MTRALWLLLALQTRGWVRSLGRGLGTVKGVLVALVGLAICGIWIGTVLIAPREHMGLPPQVILRYGPSFLIVYCLLSVLLSHGERSLYFNPAEVNFLFAGPFTRRQLLVYKLTSSALIGLPTTLFLLVLLRPHAPWFLAGYVGLYLTFMLMQLFTMAINLIFLTIGERAYSRGRKLVLLLIGGVIVGVGWAVARKAEQIGPEALFDELTRSPIWQTLTTPFRWFLLTFVAAPGDWLGLLGYGVLSLPVLFGFLLIVLFLDTHFLEAAATTSERIYAQLQRWKRGEAASIHLGGPKGARFGVPAFPWWGGVGPLAWRQATTATRSLGRVMLLLFTIAPILILPVFGKSEDNSPREALGLLMGMLVWLSLMLSLLLPFDFRGDLDRLEVLKTLPISPTRMALGQVLVPAVLLFFIQGLCVVTFGIAKQWEASWIIAGLAFALPLNLFLFTMDNLFFLWFPFQIRASNPGDFQAIGRNVLLVMAKTLSLALVGGLSGGLGLLAWFLTGYDLTVGMLAGWAAMMLLSLALLPLLGVAFYSFDVSRDLPA